MKIKTLVITNPEHVEMELENLEDAKKDYKKTVIHLIDDCNSISKKKFTVNKDKFSLICEWKKHYFVQKIDSIHDDLDNKLDYYLVHNRIIAIE